MSRSQNVPRGNDFLVSFKGAATAVIIAAGSVVPLSGALIVADTPVAHAQSPNAGGGGNGGNAGGNGRGAERGGGQGQGGGQGGGQGRGGGNAGGNPEPGARGSLASAFGALNAVNANPRALERASPDSMPGRIYIYQQSGGIDADGIGAYTTAAAEVARLTALGAEVLAAYDLDGDGVLSDAEQLALSSDIGAQQAIVDTYAAAYAALSGLGENGLALSAEELEEFNALLGL